MNSKNSRNNPLILIGNGPSLNNFDLRDCGYPTMAMNGICAYQGFKDGWHPTYYVCMTTAATEQNYQQFMIPAIDRAEKAFLNSRSPYRSDNCFFINRDETLNWHDDIFESVSVFGTSTLACMQIAAWLGFDEIYMIGFDGGYHKPVDGKLEHYFSPDYPRSANVDYEGHDWEQLNEDHQKALSFGIEKLNERGIKVYEIKRLR